MDNQQVRSGKGQKTESGNVGKEGSRAEIRDNGIIFVEVGVEAGFKKPSKGRKVERGRKINHEKAL